MSNMNEVNYYIMNDKFEDIAPLDDYESLIWTDRYADVGDFEIYTGITEQAKQFFKMNYYLRSLFSEHVMILSSNEVSSDVESGNTLIIRGESLESILKRRIVWTQTNLQGNLQDELERLFNENIIQPSIESRKIDNFIFVKSTDEYITSLTVQAQFTGDSIFDVAKSLCDKFKLGFKITLTPEKQFAFMLYYGKNRTYGQKENPYVVISKVYDNIVSSDYLVSNDTLRNVALVAGEGEGLERKTFVTGNEVISGLNRRELYVDARDISSDLSDGEVLPLDQYNALLKQRGDEKLSENRITQSFDGQIDPLSQFKYQEDYFIGDIIQFEDGYGNTAHARVSEYIYSESNNGTEAYPTLDIMGDTVTYYVDIDNIHTEEVNAGETVLDPKTFTPKKNGWTFRGWRQDDQPIGEVEAVLTMGYEPISLYAVFSQDVVVTYYDPNLHVYINYKYYNNGNIANPKFTILPAEYPGWTFRGWTTSSSPDGDILYPSLNNTEIESDVVLYQAFEQTITLTLYNGNPTAVIQSKKAYTNGDVAIYPTFTAAAVQLDGWTFRGWSTSSAGNSSIAYTEVNNLELRSSLTLYALYQMPVVVSYNSNGGQGSMPVDSKLRYFSSIGTYIDPVFALAQNGFSYTGYGFVQWRMGSTTGTAYAPGSQITLQSNTVFYAEWILTSIPFYLVSGYSILSGQTLVFTINSADNAESKIQVGGMLPSYVPSGFSEISNPAMWVVSHGPDQAHETRITASSNIIDAKGNKHVRIKGSIPAGTHGVNSLSANGKTLVQTDALTEYKDFDEIIELTNNTLSLTASLLPYPYSNAYIWIEQIYFY